MRSAKRQMEIMLHAWSRLVESWRGKCMTAKLIVWRGYVSQLGCRSINWLAWQVSRNRILQRLKAADSQFN